MKTRSINWCIFISQSVTTQCVFLGWAFLLTTGYCLYGLNICKQLEALINAGIITCNVEVDLRAIHASSLISESLSELLWIKVVSVSNSGAGPAVLQWQVICWSGNFWQIWHFVHITGCIFFTRNVVTHSLLWVYGCVWQISNVVTQEWHDCNLW